MIQVTARVGGGLGGQIRVEPLKLALSDASSVQDALEKLAEVVGEDVFLPSVLVAVNGMRVDAAERAAWTLSDGDVVSVVSAMAGG